MPEIRKLFRKSVAIQSTDLLNIDVESGTQTARLCKKAGFGNLLRKSVTIATRGNDSVDSLVLHGGNVSRSVQATLNVEHDYSQPGHRVGGMQRREYPGMGRNEDYQSANSQDLNTDRRSKNDDPGTSGALSSVSVFSQLNERLPKTNEGSLALVYSYGDKPKHNSRSSSAVFYESRGSRRFSDETVLLIEDYLSYDYNNAARRQRLRYRHQRENFLTCCKRQRLNSQEVLNRPLPIPMEEVKEKDESLVCRICHEGEDVEPLLQPCLCKGSVGCVHARCLKIWLEQSSTSRCELCNYPYAIRQMKKYSRCVSIKFYLRTAVDRRSMAYDIISLVIITPLTMVGVVMCIQASVFSASDEVVGDPNFQMGNITRAGMIMLSFTIIVAYGVWIYTMISYHYKSWKKWYSNCYDVEVLPVRMTSEERLEAARRLGEEMNRRQQSREQGSGMLTVLQPSRRFNQISVPITSETRSYSVSETRS